jgi:hypothetical protein
MTMKNHLLARLLLSVSLFLVAAPSAWSQIYRCVDAENHVTYSNVASAGKKECERVQLEPETTLPPVKPRSPRTATDPDFPKVSGAEQSAKDNDRRVILNQELSSEQKALEQARKELEEQKAVRLGDEKNYQKVLERLQPYEERVAQHERNIQTLNKEIANLK